MVLLSGMNTSLPFGDTGCGRWVMFFIEPEPTGEPITCQASSLLEAHSPNAQHDEAGDGR
jgi:hypothetical protein